MKARVTIIGNLTKDAENIVTKSGKEQCKFSIAVNLTKEKGFFVDCFFNMPLAKDQLEAVQIMRMIRIKMWLNSC